MTDLMEKEQGKGVLAGWVEVGTRLICLGHLCGW